MPGPRRFQTISVTASCVTGAAVALWAVAISGDLGELHTPVLSDDRAGAVMAGIAAVFLWTARWLANFIATGGIVFMIDAMLSQRTWYRRRLGTATAPQRKVASPRHAR